MVNTLSSNEVTLDPIHIKIKPLRTRRTRYIGHLFFSLIVLHLLTCMAEIVNAQDVQKPKLKALYYTMGIGAGTLDLAAQFGLTVDFPAGEFIFRHAFSETFVFGTPDRANDISVLYGLRRVNGTIWYDLAGGVGGVWVNKGGRSGAGLAFQSTFAWRAVGVSILGNVNGVRSFAAVTLNLHIGKVR